MRIERSVRITASDGTKLAADVYRHAAHFGADTAIDDLSCRKKRLSWNHLTTLGSKPRDLDNVDWKSTAPPVFPANAGIQAS